MNKKALNINDLLINSPINKLTEKLSDIKQIQLILNSVIDSSLINYYRVANIKNNILIIETKNAAIRLSIITYEEQIKQELQLKNILISSIIVKVHPDF